MPILDSSSKTIYLRIYCSLHRRLAWGTAAAELH